MYSCVNCYNVGNRPTNHNNANNSNNDNDDDNDGGDDNDDYVASGMSRLRLLYTLPLIELIGLSAATHCMGFRTTDFRGVEGENRRKDE